MTRRIFLALAAAAFLAPEDFRRHVEDFNRRLRLFAYLVSRTRASCALT